MNAIFYICVSIATDVFKTVVTYCPNSFEIFLPKTFYDVAPSFSLVLKLDIQSGKTCFCISIYYC